jgi:hypothetical protein
MQGRFHDDGSGSNYRAKLLKSKLTALEGYMEELRIEREAYEMQRAAEERRTPANRPPMALGVHSVQWAGATDGSKNPQGAGINRAASMI